MYIEFAGKFDEIDAKFDQVNAKFDEINAKFDEVNAKLDQKADKADIGRLENELTTKVNVLFDGQKQNSDQLEKVIARLDAIEEKVESHDIRIAVLDKRKKSLK
ncbi:MAG: hypothetical protein ACOX4H_02325 [Bacillota bacterium]|jgi:tetrahydromethanopterin S-methyltransferase subunit G